ncbi:concanavalin A-like lectin/glucanase domain-containing protein [Hyaloscypha sp. PMI_1271]|nr:concanavalin A-like lectin/glucanase domain-containing protein [Hyaloscypha sp. PMI_1271]
MEIRVMSWPPYSPDLNPIENLWALMKAELYISRARTRSRNPFLTNRNTTQYFQGVGHADLFQDEAENWWGVALGQRSGSSFKNRPMGRERSLFPVTWPPGQTWPIVDQVRGRMSDPLPPVHKSVPGKGAFVNAPDIIDFGCGSSLPLHFSYYRFPTKGAYTVSPPEKVNTLRLTPSILGLSGNVSTNASQTFVGHRQVDSLLTYSVDINFDPKVEGEESGVTAFVHPGQHQELGIVWFRPNIFTPFKRYFRFRDSQLSGPQVILPVDSAWSKKSIRLQIQGINETHFAFSAGLASSSSPLKVFATVDNSLLDPTFDGAFLGVYATSNSGNGTAPSYIRRWRYQGKGQIIDNGGQLA